MPKTIEISDETFAILQRAAIPLEDTVDTTIRRMAAKYFERTDNTIGASPLPASAPDGLAQIPKSFAFTKPRYFKFAGEQKQVSSYKDLYVQLCAAMAARHATDFNRVFQLRGRSRTFFAETPDGMTQPQKVPGTSLYAETNFSADNIVDRCIQLIELFGYKPGDLHIEFVDRGGSPERPAEADEPPQRTEETTMTWVAATVEALRQRGGRASLHDLYRDVPVVRGGIIPDTYDAIIRGTLECHSSDSRNYRPGNTDYFYSVGGIGSGNWGLRAEYLIIARDKRDFSLSGCGDVAHR